MTRLVVVRHGATQWNAQARIQGRADVPLSAAGRAQVARWRLPLAAASLAWTASPLRRAVETAALLGAGDVAVEPRLIEMDWGAWEGHRLADLRRDLGPAFAVNEALGLDFRAEGGESPREVQERLKPWLAEVAEEGRATIAVTHKGVMRALIALATGWRMQGDNPARHYSSVAHLFVLDPRGQPAVERLDVALEES